MPQAAVQRNASSEPLARWPQPTTTEPSALTPAASLSPRRESGRPGRPCQRQPSSGKLVGAAGRIDDDRAVGADALARPTKSPPGRSPSGVRLAAKAGEAVPPSNMATSADSKMVR